MRMHIMSAFKSKLNDPKLYQGINKKSAKQRFAAVLSTYKYLLDEGRIKYNGPAAARYEELLRRKRL